MMPTWTRIHCRDELELGRKLGLPGGAGNVHAPGFERLAQGFEHFSVKFRQFIQKQNSLMRQTDFAGPWRIAAADQRYRRGSMVRLAVRAQAEGFRPELADQRQHSGRGLGRFALQGRHEAGQAGGEHRFAGTRWADHQ
jgi:hypothetical protein